MKVLINAASAHMGGAVTYLQNLIRWLPCIAPEDHFTIVLPERTRELLLKNNSSDNVDFQALPFENTGGLSRFYFDQVEIGRLIKKIGADILFSSTGFGTWISPVSQVLLVRNFAYFDPRFHARYRELGRSLRKNTIRRWLSLISMRRAEVVVFPTEAMRALVQTSYRLNGINATAIHYGYDADALRTSKTVSPSWKRTIEDYRDAGYFIFLNVSTYSVQKNLEVAVDAVALLVKKGHKVAFVTTTSRERTTDQAEYDEMLKKVHESGVSGNFIEIGYVPYQQLGHLYELAHLYVFPSITESFGHSMVEAMANGLPVIAADTAVNREICGPAGIFFNPESAQHLALRIEHLLRNSKLRSELSTLSRQQARLFSWSTHFESLHSIFCSVSKGVKNESEKRMIVDSINPAYD